MDVEKNYIYIPLLEASNKRQCCKASRQTTATTLATTMP